MPFDPAIACPRIVSFLSDYLQEAGASGYVVGLSGGVDSATVAALCARAVGPSRVLALSLPFEGQDSTDARRVVDRLGIELRVIPIAPMWESFRARVKVEGSEALAWANLKARIRASILYLHSNSMNYLVAGTGNKSEALLGYFSKFGDGAVDVLPIGGLYKTRVWALARFLGVPLDIVEKVPSAGLWEGQTDEGELGVSYAELDAVLEALVDKGLTPAAAQEETGVEQEKIDSIMQRMRAAGHKLAPPPIAPI